MTLEHPSIDTRAPWLRSLSRRSLLASAGGVAAASALATVSHAHDLTISIENTVDVESLGTGVLTYSLFSSVLLGDTMYVGSRNVSPPHVAAFNVTTGVVTTVFPLVANGQASGGTAVYGLAADPASGVLYAGLTQATAETNLFRINLADGSVDGLAALAGQHVMDIAVAPDGVVFVACESAPGTAAPIYSYDPTLDSVANLGTPLAARQGLAIAATNTTIFYGCDGSLVGTSARGVHAIDRVSQSVTTMDDTSGVRGHMVRVLGDRLVVSRAYGLRVWNLPAGTDTKIDLPRVGTGPADAWQIGRDGDELVVVNDVGLHSVSLTDESVVALAPMDPQIAGFRYRGQGVGLVGTLAVSTLTSGHIWVVDRATGDGVVHDLGSMEAVASGQLGMSVATIADAGATLAVVGGNNKVDVHRVGLTQRTGLAIPGEVKDMVQVGNSLYMCVYPYGELRRYTPSATTPLETVATFLNGPAGALDRPQTVRWDAASQVLAVAVASSSTGGGAVCLIDPDDGDVRTLSNPFGVPSAVWSVACAAGVVYAADNVGRVGAWDIMTEQELWQLSLPGGVPTRGLVQLGAHLYAQNASAMFVIDSSLGTVVSTINLAGTVPVPAVGRLIESGGFVYGATKDALYRLDPISHQISVLVDELDGQWFGWPSVSRAADGWFYTLAGLELIRVEYEPDANQLFSSASTLVDSLGKDGLLSRAQQHRLAVEIATARRLRDGGRGDLARTHLADANSVAAAIAGSGARSALVTACAALSEAVSM